MLLPTGMILSLILGRKLMVMLWFFGFLVHTPTHSDTHKNLVNNTMHDLYNVWFLLSLLYNLICFDDVSVSYWFLLWEVCLCRRLEVNNLLSLITPYFRNENCVSLRTFFFSVLIIYLVHEPHFRGHEKLFRWMTIHFWVLIWVWFPWFFKE